MRKSIPFLLSLVGVLLAGRVNAAILTVTTTNNVSPAGAELSLLQALSRLNDGDEIRFNIPGAGPHYIATPAQGYPFITNQNVIINGYSQPGAAPNTNPILAANNAKIRIVLDSREGGHTPMAFPLRAPNDDRGYERTEGAVLAAVDAQGLHVQGLGFLGVPQVGTDAEAALYFIALGRGASGHVRGCWLGVDPDGNTVSSAAVGVAGFRYRGRDAALTVTNTVLVNDVIIGVEPKAVNAVEQFNVLVGMPDSPIYLEGDRTRISGNFITVLPDGLRDVNVALDERWAGRFAGAIKIGRGGNSTLIGTDGDGVNDTNERNVMGGMLPMAMDGYEHLIEFYGQNPGTNVVIAGNYIGVGVDGRTRFTNGVSILNASGPAAEYRIGSDFNGVSDDLEGNLIANNYPFEMFPAADFAEMAESLSFLSQLNPGATVSLRGNSLINNFPFPVSPLRDGGFFLSGYYSKVLQDPTASPVPTVAETTTRTRLRGTVPLADPNSYGQPIVDVYIADPVGITNGMAAGIAELPQGFVQGLTYLGSFTEGSGADLNATLGEFEFDISRFNVPAGAPLTVTANYVAASGGGGEAGSFSGFARTADGSLALTWTSGRLQSAPSVTGPWSDENVTGTSAQINTGSGSMFFRLQSGGASPTPSTAPPLTSPFSNAVEVR
jgi:hypothetical protein